MSPSVRMLPTLLLIAGFFLPALAQQPGSEQKQEPLDVDVKEEVQVRLVLIDTVVVDKQGRTVPGLTRDDFEIQVGGELVPVNTLDEHCDAGALDEPRGVRHPRKREQVVSPDAARKIVLVLDYQHLAHIERAMILEEAMEFVRHTAAGGDEIMVVALTGSIRLEQRFTRDRDEVLASLERMEYDISLWAQDFYHLTEEGFFFGLQSLVTFLETVPGHKSIVFFSNLGSQTDAHDLDFASLSAAAASARCSFYPVQSTGLGPPTPG